MGGSAWATPFRSLFFLQLILHTCFTGEGEGGGGSGGTLFLSTSSCLKAVFSSLFCHFFCSCLTPLPKTSALFTSTVLRISSGSESTFLFLLPKRTAFFFSCQREPRFFSHWGLTKKSHFIVFLIARTECPMRSSFLSLCQCGRTLQIFLGVYLTTWTAGLMGVYTSFSFPLLQVLPRLSVLASARVSLHLLASLLRVLWLLAGFRQEFTIIYIFSGHAPLNPLAYLQVLSCLAYTSLLCSCLVPSPTSDLTTTLTGVFYVSPPFESAFFSALVLLHSPACQLNQNISSLYSRYAEVVSCLLASLLTSCLAAGVIGRSLSAFLLVSYSGLANHSPFFASRV